MRSLIILVCCSCVSYAGQTFSVDSEWNACGRYVSTTHQHLHWGLLFTSSMNFKYYSGDVESGNPFAIGRLRYTNLPNFIGSNINNVSLDVFIDVGLNSYGFNIEMDIHENGFFYPDVVEFSNYSGTIGNFTLLGFGNSPDNISDFMTTSEMHSSNTYLWGIVNDQPNTIPEPCSMVLAAIGACIFRVSRKVFPGSSVGV